MKQPLAYIHPDAKIDPSVVIDPFVTIDRNVEIGRELALPAMLQLWRVQELVKTVQFSLALLLVQFLKILNLWERKHVGYRWRQHNHS